MTAWDFLDRLASSFPPIVMALILVAVLVAVVIFIIGFSKHGHSFLKYGFKQMALGNSLEKRFDSLEAKFSEVKTEIDGLRSEFRTDIGDLRSEFRTDIGSLRSEFRTELATIKTNHFGHLKGFLTELTSILLDKEILNNTDKARLDNQLRDM